MSKSEPYMSAGTVIVNKTESTMFMKIVEDNVLEDDYLLFPLKKARAREYPVGVIATVKHVNGISYKTESTNKFIEGHKELVEKLRARSIINEAEMRDIRRHKKLLGSAKKNVFEHMSLYQMRFFVKKHPTLRYALADYLKKEIINA